MEEHEIRLCDEYIELVKKITKLSRFLEKNNCDSLMHEQLSVMNRFREILKGRLVGSGVRV